MIVVYRGILRGFSNRLLCSADSGVANGAIKFNRISTTISFKSNHKDCMWHCTRTKIKFSMSYFWNPASLSHVR